VLTAANIENHVIDPASIHVDRRNPVPDRKRCFATANPRYFGHERGVTFYNLVSDQFTGLNGMLCGEGVQCAVVGFLINAPGAIATLPHITAAANRRSFRKMGIPS
jgi:hypothetical protein